MAFYNCSEALNAALCNGGPAAVVNEISTTLLGPVGGLLAIGGVIILPISSGDTAFCSALFIIGFIISLTEFGVIWRYFDWANQTLATCSGSMKPDTNLGGIVATQREVFNEPLHGAMSGSRKRRTTRNNRLAKPIPSLIEKSENPRSGDRGF